MSIASDYANALHQARTPDVRLLANLRAALKRRGHEKLLPRIYSEYTKLLLADKRRAQALTVAPEAERTRVLLELYRTLVRTH